ncbi:MAG: hypothetical protein H7246_16840, partial [Phycisphaerae bacterium]|nr:hypothetical protein [Saprospiraceae bacterium]
GTAPYTYAWSNSQTTEDLSGLVAGTYTCTVTDALSCTSTVLATVSQPAQILVTIADVTLNCFTPSGTLEASVTGGVPPYQYLWSNGETTNPPQIQLPGIYGLTVTDAIGCTVGSSAYVLVDANAPIACTGPNQILTCALTQIVLDGSCSSIGANFFYVWQGPGINSGNFDNLTPTVDLPGTYTITVTNTVNGCSSTDIVTVVQDNNTPTISAPSDLALPCGGGAITLPGIGMGGPNIIFQWTTLGGNIISGANTLNPIVDEPGTYTILVVNTANGCTATASVTVNGGGVLCSTIEGRVLQDTVKNCLTDAGEPPLSGWIIKAQGTQGSYYALTDANGDYQISVESGGTYAVSAIATSVLWEACPTIPNVVATNPNETYTANDLLFQKLAGCPLLTVDISSGNLRRCFDTNHFSVSYCNNGTATAENAYVDVTLDPLFTPLSSTLPYMDLGGGVLRFLVGSIEVGECGNFGITAHLSCDAVLGQTHCTEAHIYPDIPCIPTDPLWSGASLQISSQCQSDSLRFTIKNVGTGNMANTVEYVVVEDQVMLMTAPLQLNAGQEITVSVPANGSTWRLEVEQVAYHPGHSAPAVSVEGCTTGSSFSRGFVTMFPADDADEFVDIDCRQNTASSDPNDKQAFPKGYGAAHYILPGTPLEYQIQFQNTGNDTAFTVRILDTLSTWLDPATIRPGASNHPYSWDLGGAGVLSFLFEHILLPDSNVNEPASHGFVKFTIHPRADAPLETVVENTAEIYFDFNDAIVTNTTFHRLGENFVAVGLWQPQQSGYEVLVSPNPFSDAAWLEVKGLRQNSPLHLQVFDLQGKLQMEMDSESAIFQLKKGGLLGGIYLFKIEQGGVTIGNGKLMIQD